MKEIKVYAVQNKEGEWFRRKGYGGGGNSWVPDFSNARIFGKPGGARAVITYWGKTYEDFPTPKLVELTITKIKTINETERVKEVIQKEEDQKKRWKKQAALKKLEEAKRELAEAE